MRKRQRAAQSIQSNPPAALSNRPFFELFVIVDVSFPGPIRLLVTSVSPR